MRPHFYLYAEKKLAVIHVIIPLAYVNMFRGSSVSKTLKFTVRMVKSALFINTIDKFGFSTLHNIKCLQNISSLYLVCIRKENHLNFNIFQYNSLKAY